MTLFLLMTPFSFCLLWYGSSPTPYYSSFLFILFFRIVGGSLPIYCPPFLFLRSFLHSFLSPTFSFRAFHTFFLQQSLVLLGLPGPLASYVTGFPSSSSSEVQSPLGRLVGPAGTANLPNPFPRISETPLFFPFIKPFPFLPFFDAWFAPPSFPFNLGRVTGPFFALFRRFIRVFSFLGLDLD